MAGHTGLEPVTLQLWPTELVARMRARLASGELPFPLRQHL